jgi:hypothetical protein
MATQVKLELRRSLPETDELLARVEKRVDAERRADDPEWGTFDFSDDVSQDEAEQKVREALDAEDPDWSEKVAFTEPEDEDDES